MKKPMAVYTKKPQAQRLPWWIRLWRFLNERPAWD